MIGPSSSHTAGMARIGKMAHQIIGADPVSVGLTLSPKLKATYVGHRTDAALIGGAIGLSESDLQLRRAIELAHERGVATSVDFLPEGKYPQNTALVTIQDKSGRTGSVLGTSIGGGSIAISEVDGVPLRIDPDAFHLIVWSQAPVSGELTGGAAVQSGKNDGGTISCLTFSQEPSQEAVAALRAAPGVVRVNLVYPVLPYGVTQKDAKVMDSCEAACHQAQELGVPLSEVAISYEMSRSGFTRERVRQQMHLHLQQMRASVEEGLKGQKMLYGLTSGHDGKQMLEAIALGKTISGGIVPEAVARAIGVMEYNGAMGCVVAAPTAGSAGIVPGCVTMAQDHYHFSDDEIVDALFVAGLMGVIMASRNVSFSGSVGGCQGEVGVSSAIAAAALTSLFTRDAEAACHAMAMCMKNLLGLVCDPIAGPVEVPCIKRNAVGVANAFASADMALAGIRSFIPPDEVIDALVDVEQRMPTELRCATVGGLACTATGCRVRKMLGQ